MLPFAIGFKLHQQPTPLNDRTPITPKMLHFPLLCVWTSKVIVCSDNDQVYGQRVGVMVASHNEDTVRFTLQQMQKNNIKPEDKVGICCQRALLSICFARWSALDSSWECATIFPSPWVRLISPKQPSSICLTFAQVRQASASTSTSRTDPSMKCFLTCPGISHESVFNIFPN